MSHATITEQHIAEAKNAAALFETALRDNGEPYIRLKGTSVQTRRGAPLWISDAIQTAHGDMLPDDYIYQYVSDAFAYIADAGADDTDPDDAASEFADDVDIYTSDLIAYLGSQSKRQERANEALRDGRGEVDTIDHIVMRAQSAEREEVFQTVWQALCEHVDTLDSEDER